MKNPLAKIKNIVVIGDTHFGSSIALMPEKFVTQDGLLVRPSAPQRQLLEWWREFERFALRITNGEPFITIHNGDIVDGDHHHCVQLVSNNRQAQRQMAEEFLEKSPLIKRAEKVYFIAGTAAHAGQSNQDEEAIAKNLGGTRDHLGRYCRQDLWVEMGKDLIQFAHHIGTTSSQAYKSSPAMRLMASMYGAAGEWGFRPPTIMIRSHAHDYVEVKRPNCRVVVCPAWQLKSDWVWGKDTASLPIIGGLVIRQGEEGVHIREFIRTPKPTGHIKL